jgi:hypothetical protein
MTKNAQTLTEKIYKQADAELDKVIGYGLGGYIPKGLYMPDYVFIDVYKDGKKETFKASSDYVNIGLKAALKEANTELFRQRALDEFVAKVESLSEQIEEIQSRIE